MFSHIDGVASEGNALVFEKFSHQSRSGEVHFPGQFAVTVHHSVEGRRGFVFCGVERPTDRAGRGGDAERFSYGAVCRNLSGRNSFYDFHALFVEVFF